MMASHWPPEKLPVREADLKADGYTFFGRNFISSRGIYNCTLQMRSRGQNTNVVSNSPAKEGCIFMCNLGVAVGLRRLKTGECCRDLSIFWEIVV